MRLPKAKPLTILVFPHLQIPSLITGTVYTQAYHRRRCGLKFLPLPSWRLPGIISTLTPNLVHFGFMEQFIEVDGGFVIQLAPLSPIKVAWDAKASNLAFRLFVVKDNGEDNQLLSVSTNKVDVNWAELSDLIEWHDFLEDDGAFQSLGDFLD
jgi:hypothetical protein